ncbi:MAG: hypothetical protein OHK0039_18740 [Bacteroidia bacterium]
MSLIHSTTGAVHLVAALVALAAGSIVLLLPKGDLLHRRTGYVFAVSMALLNATAFAIYDLLGHFGPFHVAAAVSSLTLGLGMLAVWRRRPDWYVQHYYFMGWSVVGLYAAFVAETGVRFLPMQLFWPFVMGASIAVALAGNWQIRRHAPRHDPA